MESQKACISSYFWQKSWPQFLQWCRLSVRENRTEQPEQLSPPSSFTQWSAAERPGWSLTDQLKTRPRLSPMRILLWSLQETQQSHLRGGLSTAFWLKGSFHYSWGSPVFGGDMCWSGGCVYEDTKRTEPEFTLPSQLSLDQTLPYLWSRRKTKLFFCLTWN